MTMTRKALGLATLGAGGLILIVSAKFSYEGFAGTFSAIPAAGWIGVGFAILAFATASAVRIFGDDRDGVMRSTAIILLAIAAIGDVAGNWQAMTLQTVEASQADQDRLAAYQEASQTMPRLRSELDALNAQLAVIMGRDIPEAQRLLKLAGLYEGKIDGKAGGATEAAMLAFGRDTQARIRVLQESELEAAGTIAGGEPVDRGDFHGWMNILLAILLTISTSLASMTGTRLLIGAADLDAISASEEAKTASAEIVDLLGAAA